MGTLIVSSGVVGVQMHLNWSAIGKVDATASRTPIIKSKLYRYPDHILAQR